MIRRAFVLSLVLASFACGGAVDTEKNTPPPAASAPTGTPSARGEKPSASPESPTVVDPPLVANPPPVANPGTTKPPSIAPLLGSDTLAIDLDFGILGGASYPGDACFRRSEHYRLDLTTWQLDAVLCLAASTSVPSYEWKSSATLTANQRAAVTTELAKLTQAPMPAICSYDGAARSLTLEKNAGGDARYIDDDYNCHHDTSVGYLAQSLAPLHLALQDALPSANDAGVGH